jgi:glutamine amidotransferase PdxT
VNVNVDAVGTLRTMLIRRPRWLELRDVNPLTKLRHLRIKEIIVAAWENAMLATVFYPELTMTTMRKRL